MVSTTRIDLQLEYPSAVVSVGILNPIQRARSMHHLQFSFIKTKKDYKTYLLYANFGNKGKSCANACKEYTPNPRVLKKSSVSQTSITKPLWFMACSKSCNRTDHIL